MFPRALFSHFHRFPSFRSAAGMVESSMVETTMQPTYVSPHIDALLSHVTDTPKVATALLDALAKHIERKTTILKKQVHAFESKWDMNFDEFASCVKAGRLAKFVSSYDVQHDLSAWEHTLSLLRHYQSLKVR